MAAILIVDDSEVFVVETEEFLRRGGWSAVGVHDGKKARELLSGSRFDAVVLDRNMPGMSGDAVLRWIRQEGLKDARVRANLQDVCVVVLTGYGDVPNAVEALKLGAFQYLQKPIKLDQLRSILAAGIAWHRAHGIRRELLATADRHAVFERVRWILFDAIRPQGVHLMFVAPDGAIEDIVGGTGHDMKGQRHLFVDRVLSGEPIVFEQDEAAVQSLGPILTQARSLIAVPVTGPDRSVIGVLDMESVTEGAFDTCWGEVLRYLGDLIGIATEIEKQTNRRIAFEREKEADRERHEAEREKLKQLEILYREFRHSIATHAQIVSMQARELLETEVPALGDERGARIRQRLTFVRDNADVIEGVVQDLKAMSAGPPQPNLASLDVAALVRESGEALRPRIGHDVELSLPEATLNVVIKADRAGLAYCLTCLIQNSIEAIEDARRTALEPRQSGRDRIELRVTEDGANVRISVQDTGIGFDEPQKPLLLQPLYSTKTRRKMSGEQKDATGRERVERILDFLAKWAGPQLDPDRLACVQKGVSILIRDGDTLSLSVRQDPIQSGLSLEEFQRTALAEIRTPRSLGGEWPDRGMGLYSVHRIVAQHGGWIEPESRGPGQGASFTLILPRAL